MTTEFYKFKVPVFKSTVWLFIDPSIRRAIDFAEDKVSEVLVKSEDKQSIRAYTYAYETEGGHKRYMLFFKPTAKPGVIAHEVKHLLNILFKWHGYNLSINNDEMECYYLEIIIDKVHDILNKVKKKNFAKCIC